MSETSAAPAPKKKSLWKKILLALIVIILVLVVVVAMQPSDYRVTRSATINAPVAAVFVQVNDLRSWNAWTPWTRLDPAMKITLDGPAAGKGAIYHWSGNDKVGEGRMTITESQPNERIQFHLEFMKPMTGTASSEFAFQSASNQTTVTWSMFGKNDFIGKAFCLVMNMDKMLGGDFEKGLASLKTHVEGAPKP